MLKLFLCDDDPLHLQHEAAYIGSLSLGAEYELETFGAPSRVLARIREGGCPDIAVLDIEMPKVDGISLAEKLNQLCPRCKIIFLTGYTDYTYDAYYADHIWYVLKTDMEKYLPAALKKAIAGANGTPLEPYLMLQQQRTHRRMPVKNVLYLERVTYRTRVKTLDEELYVRAAPMELIRHLPSDSFVRCHQSFWANAEKISALVGKSFLLVDGSKVPISRTYRQSAIEEFRRNKIAVS